MTTLPSSVTDPLDLSRLDQQAFSELVEPYRRAIQAHCYRMLGSTQEAEELVQETFLRAWLRRETYASRAPLRAWLYKIATNLCLDALERRPKRTLPVAYQDVSSTDAPIPSDINEPIWLEPFPDEWLAPEADDPETRYSLRESIRLAFMTSLHQLPPRQRAVLILRDVLDWQAAEVANLLEVSVPAVKSALHRARTTLDARQQTVKQEAVTTLMASETLQEQLERYMRVWESADADGLASLLKEEATFSMPPIPSWYQGRESVRGLVSKTIFGGKPEQRWRLQATRANGERAFGLYHWDGEANLYRAYGIQVVTFSGKEIADITTFRVPSLMATFKLPETLPA
jgi:RNA polymerase sigma-70 factor, ECF subfamily